MNTEKILKKEDKLDYKNGLFNKRGSLVLTTSELYFISGIKKLFTIPVSNIISVNAKKGLGNGIDHLYVIYDEEGKEKKIKIQHMAFWYGVAMGNISQLGNVYFESWERTIENARHNNHDSSNFNQLEKLLELKMKGVITEEEFSLKKKQILDL